MKKDIFFKSDKHGRSHSELAKAAKSTKGKTVANQPGIGRRQFLSTAATGIAGFMILPSFTVDGVRIAPSDRVVLGFVGVPAWAGHG